MKVHLRLVTAASLAVLCLAVAALPAAAADITLYSNGPAYANDTTAWAIGPAPAPHGPIITNSFYIGAPSTVTAFSFVVWVPNLDTPANVEYVIGTTAFGYDIAQGYVSLSASNLSYLWSNSSSLCQPASAGCDVYEVTVTVSPSVLVTTIGTYWLTLDDGATTNDNPLLWDQNDNGGSFPNGGAGCTGWNNSGTPCPSTAYTFINSNLTLIPSEDPDIIGHLAAPEPSSILLLGSGILGLGGIWRRKPKE